MLGPGSPRAAVVQRDPRHAGRDQQVSIHQHAQRIIPHTTAGLEAGDRSDVRRTPIKRSGENMKLGWFK